MISLEEKFKLLKNKIIFTGFINRDDVPKYHIISDIAIIPSMWEVFVHLLFLNSYPQVYH